MHSEIDAFALLMLRSPEIMLEIGPRSPTSTALLAPLNLSSTRRSQFEKINNILVLFEFVKIEREARKKIQKLNWTFLSLQRIGKFCALERSEDINEIVCIRAEAFERISINKSLTVCSVFMHVIYFSNYDKVPLKFQKKGKSDSCK